MTRSTSRPRARIPDEPFAPQLASAAAAPPPGEEWLHEVKWDGYRLLCTVSDGKVGLWSRNGLPWTDRLPEIAAAVAALKLKNGRLDGELVALRNGSYDFGALQAALAGAQQAPLRYALFDVLHAGSISIGASPLVERKARLRDILADAGDGVLLYSDHVIGHGAAAFERAAAAGLEGIVSKRTRSPYRPGRSDDWRKIRTVESEEYVVVGYTPGKGQRGELGALLLARPAAAGEWEYSGRVGSGLSGALAQRLKRVLTPADPESPRVALPQAARAAAARAVWVKPAVVVDVVSRGHSRMGLLRQPSLKGIREDKTVDDLMPRHARRSPENGRGSAAAHPAMSHPDRLVFGSVGLRKRDIAEYYGTVMPRLLPELRRRPLLVLRCPEGADAECFFQKHAASLGRAVRRVHVKRLSPGREPSLYVDSAEGVLSLVQHNVLELHCWGGTVDDPERADRMVFDLDPGQGVAWPAVIEAAVAVRERLAELSLRAFVRLSGGKGLHVVVPLNPACAWDAVSRFTKAFARAFASAHPDQFVATAGEKNRRGRIFIDYLRNARGATAIASYSLRAREGAPVAMPVSWRELSRTRSARDVDLAGALRRVGRQRRDPWQGIGTVRQRLPDL